MKVQIISLLPETIEPYLNASMLRKAQNQKAVEFEVINLRDFGIGPRKQVDDTPYGGGDGMLLKPEPIFSAVEYAKKSNPKAKVYLMTPKGEQLRQSILRQIAEHSPDMIIICARYEGYDERIIKIVDYQISVGDYILTGGELPALTLIDGVVRLLPGVLGGETSAENESFSDGQTLEYPQYTKPREFQSHKVPGVLLSGDHSKIESWRRSKQK
jgi:tRNA (guanine37-N1)-methyltransferase